DGDEGAESDMGAEAPAEHGRAERPALAQETDGAGSGHRTGERGVQPSPRVHHPQAIRPDDPHPPPPGLLLDPALELGPFVAALLDPGREDARPADPGVDALADQPRHRRCRRGDDRQVDAAGDGPDVRVGGDSQDARAIRIYREDGPAEWTGGE